MAAIARRAFAGGAVQTTLTSGIIATSTTITVAAATGWPTGAEFFCVIDPGQASEEKILCTRSGTTLTCASTAKRGVDGTAAASHNQGAVIYPCLAAADADEANLTASTLTTRGDLLTMNSTPSLARLGVGAANTVLKSDGSDPAWGTIATANIADSAVVEAKIANGAVVEAKIANSAVAEAKIANSAVATAKLADSAVTAVKLNADVYSKAVSTNGRTASYTLVLGDAGKVVEMNVASGNTLTIPTNANEAFPVGSVVMVLQTGAGQTTIAAAGGVTVNSTPGLKLRAQWSLATLIKRATDTWVVAGDVVA